eukprot:6482771-Alexandrium_andersonii.AAC.1
MLPQEWAQRGAGPGQSRGRRSEPGRGTKRSIGLSATARARAARNRPTAELRAEERARAEHRAERNMERRAWARM